MRLEPVYLLAPEPKLPPTRRRALWMAAFGCGAAMFGAGFLTGRRTREESPSALDADEVILEHAVTLAQSDDSTFLAHRAQFLYACALGRQPLERLRHGVQRLAALAVSDSANAASTLLDPSARRALARQILNIAENDELGTPILSSGLVDALRALSR
ncbi:MAG: hypothetical protein AB7I19_18960 [Planctomycetota bacterium]